MSLDTMMIQLLDYACPSLTDDEEWQLFYIETHCIAWWVTARMVKGSWEIKEARIED